MEHEKEMEGDGVDSVLGCVDVWLWKRSHIGRPWDGQ